MGNFRRNMKAIVKISILSSLLFSLAVPQMSFAGPVSGCTNQANFNDGLGDVMASFTCSLYPSASSYTINLIPNMTYVDLNGSADYYTNLIGTGYTVVINGDPFSLSDDSSGLWNQSLWTAILYWPADADGGYASDELTVYYAGNPDFPAVLTVENFDQNLYGSGTDYDPYFFVQSGDPAVYAPGTYGGTYDIYPTPEPTSLLLFGTGIVGLAGALRRKLRV
jgi:hypothetical protein